MLAEALVNQSDQANPARRRPLTNKLTAQGISLMLNLFKCRRE
jgi:hypothetical protein